MRGDGAKLEHAHNPEGSLRGEAVCILLVFTSGVECNLMCRARRIRPRSADGDIAALRRMTTLLELDLHNTRVRGDIKNLQNLTRLERLVLHHTDVRGDIESLQNLTGVDKLSLLHHTNVSGDIRGLQNLTGLEQFCSFTTLMCVESIESLQNLCRPRKSCLLFTRPMFMEASRT